VSSVVVLQARTNSSRLPAKVLLPINGVPLAVLAAERAANTGKQVIVATSTEISDDTLVNVLKEHQIKCYRGDLNNVLARFTGALADYSDDTIVFRLTGDNVVPDGRLLDEIEEQFCSMAVEYLCCNGDESGLPYGVSVEVTYLGHLRLALNSTDSSFDQEHVTPYIRRKFGNTYFRKYINSKMGHYRCTVDCFDDYLAILQLFEGEDSVGVPMLSLIEKLPSCSFQPQFQRPMNKLVLGTAQLGLDYGISNRIGQPTTKQSEDIIKTAIVNGVEYIDTARAYGASESIIGKALSSGWDGRVKVVTKLDPLKSCNEDSPEDFNRASVRASVFLSLAELQQTSLDVLLLHRAEHLTHYQGVLNEVVTLQKDGRIKQLGVSVQTPEELQEILSYDCVTFIQMPFNILDWRWDKAISLLQKKAEAITVHVRSVYLQGLLLSDDPRHWACANVTAPENVITWLKGMADNYREGDVASLCLGYVASMPWIDAVVIGMESKPQLISNLRIFNQPSLDKNALRDVVSSRPVLDEASLNPAKWVSL